MSLEWQTLGVPDKAVFWTTVEFVDGRLADPSTVEWALGLGLERRPERLAITHLLHRGGESGLGEPWATVWGLIEESWMPDLPEHGVASDFEIRQRISGGERSGALASMIAALVAPRVRVEPPDPWTARRNVAPKVPGDLIRPSLTSPRPVTPDAIGLSMIDEVPFLTALANRLEAEVRRGMDAGRRIGWDGSEGSSWWLGFLYRIRFDEGVTADEDSDAFHTGIAPSVKLLFAVVERLAALDLSAAEPFFQAWRLCRTQIDTRLWAAAASTPSLVSARDVEAFLSSIGDRGFWDINAHPEVATLRARRFTELSDAARDTIAKRLQALPPAEYWRGIGDTARIDAGRLHWAVRELRRIELCGGNLPSPVRTWVEVNVARFRDLAGMDENEGLPGGPDIGAYVVPSTADPKYDGLEGCDRLDALEAAWAHTSEWGQDRALGWLEQDGRAADILVDLQSTGDGGASYPRVWLRFGRCHRPSRDGVRDRGEARAVLSLIEALPDRPLRQAVDGITEWMSTWRADIVKVRGWWRAWLRVWPIAVDATNRHYGPEDIGNLSVLVQGGEDLDAYNTPAAHLVGVFLQACGSAGAAVGRFRRGAGLRQVRTAIEAAHGQSLLIARHRLIEWLPFFLQAGERWAVHHLVAPLRSEGAGQLALWRAVSRRRLSAGTLSIIGRDAAIQVTNPELDARSRRDLAFSLVAEILISLHEARAPAVSEVDVQQVLRRSDDEIRTRAAETLVRFAAETQSAEAFTSVVAPFLDRVWPQDRNLRTPGVSEALARLPLRSGESFAQAVDWIRHLLVPFDCHSIRDFGFALGEPGATPGLDAIDDEAKAKALLELLDITVAVQEGAVVPYELSDALARIREVWSALAASPAFRRLEAAARR